MLHVCPLSRVPDTVERTGARRLVTLINTGTPVARPASIAEADHLYLGMNDIVAPVQGLVAPGAEHIERLLDFVSRHGRDEPLVIHCWAGISRSTAAAFIAACHLAPERNELDIARTLRACSATATPNLRLVEIADKSLQRGGRMVKAIQSIGRGRDAFEGEPFHLPLGAEAP